MKKWICTVCGFIYDEEKGIPDEGIPAGTKWDDVPEDWECPICSVGKSDFVMEELPNDSKIEDTDNLEKLVIIGSGVAGIGLAQEIQSNDKNKFKITVVTQEEVGYYSRPLLSHSYSSDESFSKVLIKTFKNIEANNLSVEVNTFVKKIDRGNKKIIVEQSGSEKIIEYDILILATGSSAFIPSPWLKNEKAFYVLNTYEDMLKIRKLREEAQNSIHWGIIGGGLIGCEIASDLNKAGDKISLIHGMNRLMERVYSIDKSDELKKHFENLGISVYFDSMVESIEKVDAKVVIKDKSQEIEVDHTIVAVGFRPRIQLAKEAQLETNRGIITNSKLQTSDKNIFAIGDVAEVEGSLFPFISPIRSQVKWLAKFLTANEPSGWVAPKVEAKAKIHGFE